MLRLSGTSSTSSAAGTMRLKRLIKPPAQPVVLDLKINENKFGKSDYATEFYNILLCEEVAFSFEKNIGMGVICGSIMRQYCAVENKHGDRS